MSVDELLDVLPALRRVAGKLILGRGTGQGKSRGTGRGKSQDGGSGSEVTSIAHLIGREIREKHLPACSAFMHRYIETHEMQDLDGIMLAELERRKLERKAAGHAC